MGSLQSKEEEFKQALEKNLVSLYPSPKTRVIKTMSRKPTKSTLQNCQTLELIASPIEEKNEVKVKDVDERKQILTTSKWPNSVHGLLVAKIKGATCYGTGIMIGPNIVLTAGHNLYDYKRKIKADLKSMQFLPGMSGKVLPFGPIEVEKYFVSPNYIQEEKEDYGILILKEPIGELTGYFGLACLKPEEIKTKRINITGYPYDKVDPKSNNYEMWGMEGEASSIDQDRGRIHYMINTEQGQSGSGVWYQEGENFYICGVHVSGSSFANTATMLTKAMYEQIYLWIQQEVKFKEFLLQLGDSKKLRFLDPEITADCITILINYKLDDLKILDLASKKVCAEGAKILAQNISWINLLQLNLKDNKIGAEGAKALAQNTSWINLSQLYLGGNNLGAEGAKSLAQNTSWVNLSHLDLSWNIIGAEGARALAQNTFWTNLVQLNLSWNHIDAEGAKALAQNVSWSKLSQLKLQRNNFGTEGTKALAQNTSWPNLSQLNLGGNNIDSDGARALAQNTTWNLSHLELIYNNIDTEGAKALAQNTSWTNLSKLNLERNGIDTEGELTQSTSCINVSQLDLQENNTDAEGIKALAQSIPSISHSQFEFLLSPLSKYL